MANNPLVGAWDLVSDLRVGVAINTGSHYAVVMAPKDRQRSSGERATPDEALEAIRSCQALAGTYTVSGSRLTHVRIANTRPELSGHTNVTDYTIDGDTLTHTVVSGGAAASGSSLTFRRAGSSGVGSPLVGAWELVDDTRQGVLIFTGTHYAVVQMQKERNLPKGDQYTPEEALEALYTCGALAGTYTVSGGTLTMERTANTRPESIGVIAVWEFTVEGDVMKVRVVSGSAADEATWRRVS
jgi:hypothetical protein